MNGRLYDARLRRFLSPDNFVQDLYGTQGFNRYGYAMNSPLVYVDPNGEFAFIPLLIIIGKAALTGAAIGAVSYTASVAMSDGGFNNWNWGHFGRSVGLGAASGVVSFGIGSAAGAIGGIGGYAVQTAGHAAWGGVNSMLNGGNFWSGALSGAIGNVMGGATAGLSSLERIAVSAFMGGMGSELSGGDFWQGAAVAGIVAGANHLLHDPPRKERDTRHHKPAPKDLEGFPDAEKIPHKGRARWKTPDGKILEWDKQHGDVEVYDKRGKHQGSARPHSGEMYKPPVPGRRIDPIISLGLGGSLIYGTYRLFNSFRFPMIMNTTLMTIDPAYQYQHPSL